MPQDQLAVMASDNARADAPSSNHKIRSSTPSSRSAAASPSRPGRTGRSAMRSMYRIVYRPLPRALRRRPPTTAEDVRKAVRWHAGLAIIVAVFALALYVYYQ